MPGHISVSCYSWKFFFIIPQVFSSTSDIKTKTREGKMIVNSSDISMTSKYSLVQHYEKTEELQIWIGE
jgi:hypothetical protein